MKPPKKFWLYRVEEREWLVATEQEELFFAVERWGDNVSIWEYEPAVAHEVIVVEPKPYIVPKERA